MRHEKPTPDDDNPTATSATSSSCRRAHSWDSALETDANDGVQVDSLTPEPGSRADAKPEYWLTVLEGGRRRVLVQGGILPTVSERASRAQPMVGRRCTAAGSKSTGRSNWSVVLGASSRHGCEGSRSRSPRHRPLTARPERLGRCADCVARLFTKLARAQRRGPLGCAEPLTGRSVASHGETIVLHNVRSARRDVPGGLSALLPDIRVRRNRSSQRHRVDVLCRRRLNERLFPYEPVHVGGVPFLLTGHSRAFHETFRSQSDVVHAHFGTSGMHALPYARRYRLPLR